MEQSIWQEIGQLYQKFQELGIREAVNYEKYYLYSLITHSTAIEGSTLTEAEAQMLFDEGLCQRKAIGLPFDERGLKESIRTGQSRSPEQDVSHSGIFAEAKCCIDAYNGQCL